MREYLLVLCVAAAVTYGVTAAVRWVAFRIGAITPVRDRDVHEVPIPRLGGVGMLVGFAAGVLVAANLPYLGQLFRSNEIYGVLAGAVLITLIGAVDDVRELDWLTKLSGQALAGAIMAFGGVQMLSLPVLGLTILPQPVLVAFTILIVVVSTNAVNFVDGLDGLAAGIVGVAAVAFFSWSYLLSREYETANVFSIATLVSAALLGICLGFIPHNFHPARLFMGDAGALLLGYLLAAATISMTGSVDPASSVYSTSTLTAFLLPIVLPLAVLGLPLLDILLAVVRRTRAGRAPWHPDRQHLHHRMLEIGHSHRWAVVILYAWSAAVAVGALSFAFVTPQKAFTLFGAMTALALVLTILPSIKGRQRL